MTMGLFAIKEAGTKGKGVFAARNIRVGEHIWTFGGKRYSWPAIARLIERGGERGDDPFQISEHFFLKLDPTSDYFNHSCAPNASFRNGRELTAAGNIRKGEEICYDYSTVVCTHCSWNMPCQCGSAHCRKKVRNVRSIPRAQLNWYRSIHALPAFIEKEI